MMKNFSRFLVMTLAILGLGLAGCSEDLPTQVPDNGNTQSTGVFHVNTNDNAGFEIISAKNGDPEDPIEGPFAIRGQNMRYDSDLGALIVDLSVVNMGENTFDEDVMLTFLSLLPDGVTVLNPDNDENGAGAAIVFEFENDDAMWTPGEESLLRETHFMVAEGTAIGFTARLDTGMGSGMASIGGMVWDDADGDGMMGEGEAGVPGAMLELSAEGMEAMTTMSGEDGTYRFDDLDSGFYMVSRKPMDGMVGTTANMIYVILVHQDGTVDSFMAANFGVMADDGGPAMGIIKGLVWNDLNGDGKKNDDEPGVEGIPVVLSGDASDTTATDADGSYAFQMLTRGSYEVVSLGPDGWSLTTDSPISVILDANDAVFNEGSFGWMQDAVSMGAIGGVVFNDMNGNKMRDEGEPGVGGIPVALTGDATAEATSDSTGAYRFDGLVAGSYTVTTTGPDGWVYTTGPLDIKLDTDDSVIENADHGWMEEATGGSGFIKGKVWNDLNGDGKLNDGEPGVEGIEVVLSGDADNTMTTDADGVYTFDMLSAGSYEVVSLGPDGWSLTTPSPIAVTLEMDDSVFNDGNFGWVQDAVSLGAIGGVVFNDMNGNKVRDDGEPGVAGIKVDLTGDLTASAVSDSSGAYNFTGLGAGNYTATTTGPDGWVYTTGPLDIKLDADDSVVENADHGWMKETTGGTGYIKGKVWNDLNGDGKLNDGEPGVEGIEVVLSGDADNTMTTDADGVFTFEMLGAGSYEVVSLGPDGWSLTTPSPIAVTLDMDDSIFNDAVFGWMEDSTGGTGVISGVVFNDLNGNKIKDDGEAGVAGITVEITGGASTTTNEMGLYSFLGLSAGTYTVTSLGPDGWVYTTGPLDIKLDTDFDVITDANHGWMEEVTTP